jgi:hypothetical protein
MDGRSKKKKEGNRRINNRRIKERRQKGKMMYK